MIFETRKMEEQKWIRRKAKAKAEGNLDQLSLACNKLGELHFKHNCYEDALKEYKEEATVYEAMGNVIKLAVAHRMVGEVYSSMGQYGKALKHQIKHLELARAEANQIEEQRALATIGRTYFCQAESIVNDDESYQASLLNAKNAYKKSLDLCERLRGISKWEHMEMRARLLLNIGLVLECQHEVQKAIENIQNAVQICKEHDLFEDMFRCYASLGMLHHRQHDSSKALHMLGLALDIASRLEEKIQLSCEILINKAEVLFSLPDFHGAKKALHRAYKLNTPIESDWKTIEKNLKLAIAMCNAEEQLLNVQDGDSVVKKKLYEIMGDGCVAVKNYKKALEYYRKMLECAEALGESGQQLTAVYVSLSQTYKDTEQYDLALEFFRKELELWENNPVEACNTTLNISEVLELQGASYEELEETYNRARQLAQQASSLKLEATVLRGLLGVQKLKGYDALALETQKELQLIERNVKDETSTSEDEDASPDIGHDICLETYSDSDSETEEFDHPNQPRRRPVRLKVRKNEKGETQLHLACINGNLAFVKRLVEQGHPVNIRDHCGWLPLHEACNHGHRDIVEYLVDKGGAVNDRGGSQCGGVTPLHDAASCGHLDVMELLLDHGASVVSRTNEGETPLDCLLKWYKRTDKRFGPVEQTLFEEIQMRLRTALEKAGHHVGSVTPPVADGNSTSQSHKMKKSRQSATLRRILDDASSGEEDIISGWCQTSPESDVISSVDPPQVYHQDIDADKDDGWIGSRQELQSAAEEYRNVMTMLRNKDQANKEPVLHTQVKELQAFLAEEDVGENWLEDDMPSTSRPSKKRRLAAPIEKCRLELVTGSGRRCRTVGVAEEDEDMQIDEVLTPEENRPHLNVITVPHKGRAVGTLNVPQQLTLPDVGVVTTPTSSSNKSLEMAVPQPSKSVELAASQSVRVRVENRLLLVPVPMPEQQTIGWLAREAARRYCSIEGLQPSLSLLTADGALLSDSDPVLLVVGSEEVMSTVISWNIPPLTDRYMEACQLLHSAPDTHIIACLENSQATQSLQLSDLALPAVQLAPLFRALNRQHTLQELHLAGNCLGDDGVKLLVAGLPTLCQLQELDISCNNISAAGVHHLSSIFSNTSAPVLQALLRLNLSHNPLGDGAIKHLSTMLSQLVSLTVLQLQGCHLTTSCFKPEGVLLNLGSVRVLDMSYNALGGSGVSGFLGQLCPTEIVSLNLSATTSRDDMHVVQGVILMLAKKEEFSKLTTLNLSDCRLRDEDIWNLLKELQKCDALKTLQLSGNTELSFVSLRRLLQHQPALHNIDLSGCCGIASYIRDSSPQLWMALKGHNKLESLALNSEDFGKERIEALWWEAWGTRARVHRAPGGLLCLSLKE